MRGRAPRPACAAARCADRSEADIGRGPDSRPRACPIRTAGTRSCYLRTHLAWPHRASRTFRPSPRSSPRCRTGSARRRCRCGPWLPAQARSPLPGPSRPDPLSTQEWGACPLSSSLYSGIAPIVPLFPVTLPREGRAGGRRYHWRHEPFILGTSKRPRTDPMHHLRRFCALSGLTLPAVWLWSQAPPPPAPPAAVAAPSNPFLLSPEERARLDELGREDHADMLKQLRITRLRPGPSGRAADPNAANYDPTKADPYPDWPDALTLKDGGRVTSAEMWWRQRRPEIVEDFEREVYGRVPGDVPKVTWAVAETVETTVGGQPVVARRVIGHVDNSAHPAITVDVKIAVVVPVNAKGPVPVLMMFGTGNMPGEPLPRFGNAQEPAAPPSTEQLIAAGWGYVSLSAASIQADNGAGLTAGIIGLA